MMTRNGKKRAAEKDKNAPQKSKQKYSTVSDAGGAAELGEMAMVVHGGTRGNNGAVENLGAMVTMDHGGTSGGLGVDCVQTDYRQVAWLLREKLNDLLDGDNGEFPESGLRSMLDMAASSNVISIDPRTLNPVLWRTLSKELLVLVLARLPLPDITRLRSLSTDWKKELATANSEINQACDEASSSMVTLLSIVHGCMDTFFVTIYDVTKSRWQCAYYLRLLGMVPVNHMDLDPCPHMWTPVDACDGGLMCFMSLWKPTKGNQVWIIVVNLLTRVEHSLPPLHYQYDDLPTMVQLKVDSRTKRYKVFVATYRAGGGDLAIETYDSRERQWTRAVPPSGSIFGPVLNWIANSNWPSSYKVASRRPGAYDFGEGELQLYTRFERSKRSKCSMNSTTQPPSTKRSMISTTQPPSQYQYDWEWVDRVLGKDRVFYLVERTRMDTSLGRKLHLSFHIVEYRLDNRTKAWVREKSYKCPGLEDPEVVERSFVTLNACDGFLMVLFHYDESSTYFRLLDLSTGEWRNVPEIPYSEGLHTSESKLCRAFWNVIP